jgi:hypothetical protein
MRHPSHLPRKIALGALIAGAAYMLGTRRAQAPRSKSGSSVTTNSTKKVTPGAATSLDDTIIDMLKGRKAHSEEPNVTQGEQRVVEQLLSELGEQARAELKSGLKRGLQRLERVIDEL